METRVVRGVRLALDRAGTGDELILLIHGVGSDRSAWSDQLLFFAEHEFSAVAVDCRGHGDSEVPEAISLEEFAQDLAELTCALHFERAHWVGLSMGGVIALQACRSRPETVASLVLANTFAYYPDQTAALEGTFLALQAKSLAEIARERIPRALGPDIAPEVLKGAIAAMARKDVAAYKKSSVATWTPDFRTDLRGIQVPVLVIGGSLDKITPLPLSEELAAGIPGARLVVIEGASHISNLDRPAAFNEAIRAFLRAPRSAAS